MTQILPIRTLWLLTTRLGPGMPRTLAGGNVHVMTRSLARVTGRAALLVLQNGGL